MAKRFTDTELWDKEWFMKLSPRLKCLVKLIWDKCDLSGVWSPNWIIADTYIGEKVTENELLEIDAGRQFTKLKNSKILCEGFILFQNGKLSNKSPVHKKIMQLLDTHQIEYRYPINTPQVEVEVEVKEEVEVGVEGGLQRGENGSICIFEKNLSDFTEDFGMKEKTGRTLRCSPEKVDKLLKEFILEQDAKGDLYGRTLLDLRKYFVLWAKKNFKEERALIPKL